MKLFKRGKATSRIPSCVGNKKLPNAPNNTGITTKKTITMPCNDIVVKYRSAFCAKKNLPGYANSSRIMVAKISPVNPVIAINQKYKIAKRRWFVVKIQSDKKIPVLDNANASSLRMFQQSITPFIRTSSQTLAF
jgi:hypothetical protein